MPQKIGQVTNLPDTNDLTHQPNVFKQTTFGWVISSYANRTPSLPRLPYLEPPNGIASKRKSEESLIITPPASIRRAALIAVDRSLVKIPA